MKNIITIILVALAFSISAQPHEREKIFESEKKAATAHFDMQQVENNSANDILYHEIHWTVDPAVYYISGSVKSIFKITKDGTSQVMFDMSSPLEVDSVLHSSGKLNFTFNNSIITIDLAKPLNINDMDTLTVFYKGEPAKQAGFGSFEVNKHNDTPILWTLSEPYGAKDWWPCKQSLYDKADSLDIYVSVPLGNKVGTNGILISESTNEDQITYHWKHNHPIATYLVAIAVTNYAEYTDVAPLKSGESVDILNYVYPENLESAKESTKYTVDVMQLFSDLFIDYPFHDEKYGHAQFGWGGGMEHQTMSFMGGFSQDLIAHELAHQWFGDHVTCGSWEDIWVNEGFAVYLTGLSYEHLKPENWMAWKKNTMNYVINNRPDGSVIVDDTTSVGRIFDYGLTYQKAGFVLHMLRYQIGDEAFFNACKQILTQPETSGGFANTQQVQAIFENAADTTLTDFFNEWLYMEGYPSYKIEWVQSMENDVDLSLIQTTSNESVSCFKMNVPVLFIGDNQEKLMHFHHTVANQKFSFNPGFQVNKVVFDPEYNILAPHPAWVVVDIHEDKFAEELKLYPNPTTEELIIKSNKQSVVQQIEIISNNGQHIFTLANRDHKRKINVNVADLKPGVYYVRALVNGKEVTKQFVKN